MTLRVRQRGTPTCSCESVCSGKLFLVDLGWGVEEKEAAVPRPNTVIDKAAGLRCALEGLQLLLCHYGQEARESGALHRPHFVSLLTTLIRESSSCTILLSLSVSLDPTSARLLDWVVGLKDALVAKQQPL